MKTVVLGLGNPLLHDDGAGIEAINQLAGVAGVDCELKTAAVGGLRILDQISGYDRAILVDAVMLGGSVGQVRRFEEADLVGDLHASCVHDLSLQEALLLGRSLEMPLPAQIVIYGIEVRDPYLLQEGCSSEVSEGAREAARLIARELANR
jgi:hydrogenase maturation protease